MKNKILKYGAPALALLLMAACSGKQVQNEADSTEAQNAAVEVADSLLSYDLAWQELKGHVLQCVVVTRTAEKQGDGYVLSSDGNMKTDTLQYNERGQITRMRSVSRMQGEEFNGMNFYVRYDEEGNMKETLSADAGMNFEVQRDDEGKITGYRLTDAQYGMDAEDALTFDYTWADGHVVSSSLTGYEWQSRYSYTYNDEGLLTESTERTMDGSEQMNVNEKYEYRKFDDRGNWTDRVVVSTMRSTGGEDATSYRIETRSISYY